MHDRIFPSGLNKDYHGQSLAIYVLYIILIIKVSLGLFASDYSLVELTSSMSKEVVIGIILLIIIVRYRSMIPLVFLLMLIMHSLEVYSILIYNHPSEPLAVSSTLLVICGLTIIGFLLSITGDRCYYRNNAVLKRP